MFSLNLLQVNETLRDFHFIPNLQASESRSSLTCAVTCRLNYNETAQNLQLGAK